MFVFRFASHLKNFILTQSFCNYSSLCDFVTTTSFGTRPNCALIATKMNRRWVCSDVWFDTFPFFDRPQLGLKLALLSPRFNLLVDKHFNGKRELTIWRTIIIREDSVTAVPELAVRIGCGKTVPFPLPNRPLPNKICFKSVWICYIDHSVIAFLRSNQQIWNKVTNLRLTVPFATADEQPVWGVIMHEIWPIFSANIRHLGVSNGILFDKLCRLISPSILTDLDQLNSIYSGALLPDATDYDDHFDGPNATISAGQMLSKWLHSPRKDGQPKQLHFFVKEPPNMEWANTLKKHFLRANAISSVSYQIQFTVHQPLTQIVVPFELANEQTMEKLTLIKASANVWEDRWVMKRCQNGETATAAVQWAAAQNLDDLNTVEFNYYVKAGIGPLSPRRKCVQLCDESDLMHLRNGRSFGIIMVMNKSDLIFTLICCCFSV